jgi:hypothetical protein
MTEISKSVFDPRNVALVLFGIGGTTLALGILSLNWWVLISGAAVISFGTIILFGTRSTYKIVYDNKAELFTLNSRKHNFQVRKNQVLDVDRRFTPLQLIWPFPRPYYHVLAAKSDDGKMEKYGFIIWSNEKLLIGHYKMMKRSVDAWANHHSS